MLTSKKQVRKRKQRKIRNSEYYDMEKIFDDLYAQGKTDKVFNHLMEIIESEENIKLAYRNIKRNSGSSTAGVDHRTIDNLAKLSEEEYVRLIRKQFSNYHPRPVRRVEIEKDNGKKRPLGIPTIVDRMVQQCILQVMEPICEAKFSENSNGFRPNRSAETAIAQCMRLIQVQHMYYVVDLDIKGFFDNINHRKLLRQIWALGIRDKKLICIIKEMLKAPVILPDGKRIYPEKGTPQGGIISPTLANMTLDGLQKALADRYKRHHVNGKLYSPMVNLVRYADDFIITCENKETLENEIKPLVAEFMSERGLTLSEEKTVITNVHDGFDFLGFNIRKYGKDILTKPTKKSEKRFMENIRKVIKENKGCRQESLIRMLNSKIRGWGGYYQHGATRDSFHRIDHQIFLSLWQWAKRRHSKKGKRWIKDRYWHDIRGNKWTFASKFKKPNGKEDQLTLLSLTSSFPFLQYTQIKGDMNPFDADCRLYFYKRKKSKMLVTLKGRKSLLYLWEKQGRKCPICGEPIDTHKAWNVMPTVQNGKKCNLLVHDECFKLSRKSNGNKK